MDASRSGRAADVRFPRTSVRDRARPRATVLPPDRHAAAALTTFGGWGLASEYHVERKLREGTVYVFNNLLMNLIADRALGLPKK